jgi:hypothetical protein
MSAATDQLQTKTSVAVQGMSEPIASLADGGEKLLGSTIGAQEDFAVRAVTLMQAAAEVPGAG